MVRDDEEEEVPRERERERDLTRWFLLVFRGEQSHFRVIGCGPHFELLFPLQNGDIGVAEDDATLVHRASSCDTHQGFTGT